MGIALIKIKIMPDTPSADLEAIEKRAEEIINQKQGKNFKAEREPIAFGLTAVIAFFSRDEELSTDELLEKLESEDLINSAEIIDFRRALG